MSVGCRELVGEAIDALALLSPTSFSWFGRPVAVLPANIADAMGPGSARVCLLHEMQQVLYSNLYCRGCAAPTADLTAHGLARRPEQFIEMLAASNTGSGSREPGWRVCSVESGQVVVERDGLTLWISRGDVVEAAHAELRSDVRVHVRLPNELRKLSPGFYMALGDAGFETKPSRAVVRVYWHLESATAPRLIYALTSRLNGMGLPFRVKVVSDTAHYTRCDAGVLYLHRRDFRAATRTVRAVHREVVGGLRQATPAFAKPLAPGLAIAEDPGSGESFGMHRTRLVAEGIVEAYDRGIGDRGAVIHAVAQRFAQDGLDIDRPHLNPGSAGVYAL